MTRVTVNAQLQQLFLNFTKPLELCDESGAVRAKLVPCPVEDANEWIDLTAGISDEEIEREIEAGDFCTTQELMDEIRKRNDK